MGVDFELPTVKNYTCKLLLFPELFFKIFIILLAVAGIVLMVELGFNGIYPAEFCNDDLVEDGAFRFCLNSIACNTVVILVSATLIFVDLLRACLTTKQWKRLVALFVIIIAIPLTAYMLASSSLVLKNYTTRCDERSCSDIEQRRFLTIPIMGFVASIFYLIVSFLSFLRLILSGDD